MEEKNAVKFEPLVDPESSTVFPDLETRKVLTGYEEVLVNIEREEKKIIIFDETRDTIVDQDNSTSLTTTPNVDIQCPPIVRKRKRKMKSEEEWFCSNCPKKFSTENFMHSHMKNKHTESAETAPEFPCTVCPKKFSAEDYLKQHQAGMHTIKNGQRSIYICPQNECSLSFSTIPDFNNHKFTHMTKCTKCETEMYASNMSDHMANKHPDTNQQM